MTHYTVYVPGGVLWETKNKRLAYAISRRARGEVGIDKVTAMKQGITALAVMLVGLLGLFPLVWGM